MRRIIFLSLFLILLINIFLFLTINISDNYIYFLVPIFFISNLIITSFYLDFLKKEFFKNPIDSNKKKLKSADEHPIIASARVRLGKN